MTTIKYVCGILSVNCYILFGQDSKACVVDPGGDGEGIEKIIYEKNKTLDKILLTHGHFDHTGAVEYLRKKFPVSKVYIHRSDAEMLCNDELNCRNLFKTATDRISKADVFLKDGDLLNVCGEIFTVIGTPGHTKGSVCYTNKEIMFSGDTLLKDYIGRTDLPTGSDEDIRNSLKTLKKFDDGLRVYPGHGETTVLSYEKENNMYLKYLR